MSFIIPTLCCIVLFAHMVVWFRPKLSSLTPIPWVFCLVICTLPSWPEAAIGHEAVYEAIYYGGLWFPESTLAYPAMQLWWYVWGMILWHHPWGLIFVPILTSTLIIVLFIRILDLQKIAGKWLYCCVALLLIHPEWASWMGKIHNIMPPLFMAMCAQRLILSPYRNYMAPIALSLAICMRVEFILLLPFFLFQIPWKESWKPLLIGAFIFGFAIPPLLTEIPGEEEHWLSFQINLPILSYWYPALWIILPLLLMTRDKISWAIAVYIIFIQLICSTFNDFGPRHIVMFCPIIIWILMRRQSILILCLFFVPLLWERWQHEKIFAITEEDFSNYIEDTYPNLPRLSLEQTRTEQCAWIVEEEPFAEEKIRSHFNLYNPQEEYQLRQQYGCIHWCETFEDYRWSSLSIRDRSIRIKSLFATEAVAIVQEKDHSCIVRLIKQRQRAQLHPSISDQTKKENKAIP